MNDCTGTLVSNNSLTIIPKKVKCLKLNIKQRNSLFVFVWNDADCFIYNIESNCSGDGEVILKNVGKDILKFKYSLVEVFVIDDCIFTVDKVGAVYELHYKVRSLAEDNQDACDSDMFAPSPGFSIEWSKSVISKLELCDTVKSVTTINTKFVTVVERSNTLFGQIYFAKPFKHVFSINLYVDAINTVVVSCTDVLFSKELKQQYLSFPHSVDNELAFVGLGSGQTLCFSTNTSHERPNVILSFTDAVLDIQFYFDEAKKYCTKIVVIFSSGQIFILDGKSQHNIYIPGPLNVGLINDKNLDVFASNKVDSFISRISFDSVVTDTCMSVSLKDVQCVCIVPGIVNILLVSSSNCIYWLDTEKIFTNKSNQYVLPKEKAFQDLLSVAKQLNDLHVQNENTESIITAISYASRAQSLEKFFVILAKFYSGRRVCDDKLKLRIENDCEFASFIPKLWHLNVMISFENKCVKSYKHSLTKSFTKDSPITCEINCSPFIESEISCKLIARIDFQGIQRTLIVPLGKVILDAGYFFSTVRDKVKLFQQINEINSKKVSNINGCSSSSNTAPEIQSSPFANICVYSLKINEIIPVEKIFHLILRNSSHRLSKKQWLQLTEGETTEVTLTLGENIWLEICINKETRVLTFKSNDAVACYSVKSSVSSRLSSKTPVELDVEHFVTAEGIKWRFQLDTLSSNWDMKQFQDLKQQFRQVFS